MDRVRYASAWHRFIGYMIDGIILNVFLALLIMAVAPSGGEPGEMYSTVIALYWLVTILYFTIMEASAYQATLGKMAIGVKIIDAKGGGRISYLRAFARLIVFSITVIFILPLFVIFFSSRKRMLHDMVVGSEVTDRDAEYPGKYRWQRRLAPLLVVLSILFPAVVGTYYVDKVVGEFLESAEAQMMMQEMGSSSLTAVGQMQGNQTHTVTRNAQGKVISESYKTTHVENGVDHSSGYSWSYETSYSASGSAEVPNPSGADPKMNGADSNAQLISLAKGTEDADYGVVRLIVSGADVNAKDEQGYTPLYYAVKQHHVEMTKALVYNHARTDVKYPDGMTVWKLAAGDRELGKALRYHKK